jgi:hypothetical protein
MFENDILIYLDEDTNTTHNYDAILGSMKRVKRKTKKILVKS